MPLKSEYTAVIKQDEGGWIGWIEEVPGINATARNELTRSGRKA